MSSQVKVKQGGKGGGQSQKEIRGCYEDGEGASS